MKRWFKLIAYARAEGEMLTIVENGRLYHLGTLFSFCQSGDTQILGLEPPIANVYVREVLPSGLSPMLYWFIPPLEFFTQTELRGQIVPEHVMHSHHEWPSSSS